MLVLSRKIGEVVVIGNSIKVTVLGFDRGFVKLGIEAPRSIPVHRQEIYDKIIDINRRAASTEVEAVRDALQKSALRITLNTQGTNNMHTDDSAEQEQPAESLQQDSETERGKDS